jgi:hypothetical protein
VQIQRFTDVILNIFDRKAELVIGKPSLTAKRISDFRIVL